MADRPSGLPVGDLLRHGAPTVDLPVPAAALAVAAHPDDAEFGCGATLAKWADAGARVHLLVLTDGSKGTWDEADHTDALVARRREETLAAMAALVGPAAGVQFLDAVDGELDSGVERRRQVCAAIRAVAPDLVLGHDPWRRYQLHPDHRHAGWLTTDAVVAARDPKFFPDVGPAHRPRGLLLWEADEPDHVESVSGFAGRKVTALLAHHSQYRSSLGLQVADGAVVPSASVADFADRVGRQLAAHGRLAHVEQGEAFRLLHV